MAHHTTPQEAGIVFARTRPKLAAYTHIVTQSTPNVAPVTIEAIVMQTRETYSGPLQVGEDLMSFEIDERGVTIRSP
jgi:ribonuclease Z